MEKLTFEQLPQAVAMILEKLRTIEQLLQSGPRPIQTDEMLNVQQAADFLHITKSALYTKVYMSQVPYYKFGKRLLFNREEILQSILSTRRKTAQEMMTEAEKFSVPNLRKADRFRP